MLRILVHVFYSRDEHVRSVPAAGGAARCSASQPRLLRPRSHFSVRYHRRRKLPGQ